MRKKREHRLLPLKLIHSHWNKSLRKQPRTTKKLRHHLKNLWRIKTRYILIIPHHSMDQSLVVTWKSAKTKQDFGKRIWSRGISSWTFLSKLYLSVRILLSYLTRKTLVFITSWLVLHVLRLKKSNSLKPLTSHSCWKQEVDFSNFTVPPNKKETCGWRPSTMW